MNSAFDVNRKLRLLRAELEADMVELEFQGSTNLHIVYCKVADKLTEAIRDLDKHIHDASS